MFIGVVRSVGDRWVVVGAGGRHRVVEWGGPVVGGTPET